MIAVAPQPAAAAARPPSVTIAVLPGDTEIRQLGELEAAALGFVSAGIGRVPAGQTYLDLTQGNRVSQSLYDFDLPALLVGPRGVSPAQWRRVRERAASAPGEIVPGLLAATLERAAVPVRAEAGLGPPALLAIDDRGRVRYAPGDACAPHPCPGLFVRAARPRDLDELAARLSARDLLVALERPPPGFRVLDAAVVGAGFDGLLTSDSTRTDGLVTTTDLAPTILEWLGVAVPGEFNGEPVRGAGEADVGELESLEDRLEVTGPRRTPVIRDNLLVWVALTVLVAALSRGRLARPATATLGLAVVYLPAVLLVTAALEPSLALERLVAGVGAPVLAAATLAAFGGWRALAVAAGVTVGGYAADVVAGSALTPHSLPGPNPASGSRFYGIGNEIEATMAALVPLGAGAALASSPATRDGGRRAALLFLVAGALATAAFALGRFGADVGAAIVLPAGAAVAAAVAGRSRGWVALAVLAPVAGIAALVLLDLVLGGDAHLTRSLLDAGGFEQAADTIERRIRLAAISFQRGANVPYLALVALALGLAAWRRRDLERWFATRSARAGLLGAVAATVVGTASNDSGALLLIVGALFIAAASAFAWARSGAAR